MRGSTVCCLSKNEYTRFSYPIYKGRIAAEGFYKGLYELKDELKDKLKDNTPVTKEEFKKKAVEEKAKDLNEFLNSLDFDEI